MTGLMAEYATIAGADVVDHLRQLAGPLKGAKVVHVNSTRSGGGVAEILDKLVPLMVELGLDARWEVLTGNESFFRCTKRLHNGLQGYPVALEDAHRQSFDSVSAENAERLRPLLEDADVVFIHDPQPAALLDLCPNRRGRWIWRCHIDLSHPHRPIWRFLRPFVAGYDASVFSLAGFAQSLPHPQYLIPPSIDPLSDKNRELPEAEIAAARARFGIDPERPLITQISRFDRFKDPLGVIAAYRLVKRFLPPLQLVLAGGSASDDPEGAAVLQEVRDTAGADPDIHVLDLPPDSHRCINALQRTSRIVLQKSLREGFGLTVTEAMWKQRPVIGGDTGGIRLQVVNYHTGFRVSTPEGAALRIRYLLHHPELLEAMGTKAQTYVRENFLLTRQLREYLTLMLALNNHGSDRIELG